MSSMHQRADGDLLTGNHGKNPILHIIDFEDVALSPLGIQMVEHGAKALLRKFMPAVDPDKLTRAQAFAMFVSQVYWEENTGGLIMCTELKNNNLCLPIPSKHWSVRQAIGYVH